MTVQDIQSLIAEIDSVLVGEEADPSRSQFASQTARHEILEKVRSYLVSVGEREEDSQTSRFSSGEGEDPQSDRLAEVIASAVVEKLDFQRAVWMQPWQMELEGARQHRSSLLREIQQLEGQRQQLVGDFLQVLLGRVSESLKQEISQTLEKIETQFVYSRDEREGQSALPNSPTQRLEQLQQLQVQSDRLLMSLDQTFRHVFETLEQDLQGYEESLSAAIARMYELGRQGEPIAEGLRPVPQEAQTPQSARQEVSNSPNAASLNPLELGTREQTPSEPSQLPSPPLYPFPGIELPSREPDRSAEDRVDIDAMDDSEIDALLQIEGDEERDRESTPAIASQPIDSTLPPPPVPQVESDRPSQSLETQLFGNLDDPAVASDTEEETRVQGMGEGQQPASIEAGLFGAANTAEATPSPTTTAATPPTAVEVPQAKPMSAVDEPIPNLADTITSLTELLEQAYTRSEPEAETFSAVPPGESLLAVEEASLPQEPIAEQALEDAQLGERLAEDLQRFGNGNEESERTEEDKLVPTTGNSPDEDPTTAESFELPPEPPDEKLEEGEFVQTTGESFEPPAELLGEDLEAVDLEDLWSEHQEETSGSESEEEENLALPVEIETDPWSEPSTRSIAELGTEGVKGEGEQIPPQD
ncbi:MAG: hypothetical protein SW833_09135 [Cyanobacteriota bacterium]|nr:hypothetical protein [Cyanobacteriota bacterium]